MEEIKEELKNMDFSNCGADEEYGEAVFNELMDLATIIHDKILQVKNNKN